MFNTHGIVHSLVKMLGLAIRENLSPFTPWCHSKKALYLLYLLSLYLLSSIPTSLHKLAYLLRLLTPSAITSRPGCRLQIGCRSALKLTLA